MQHTLWIVGCYPENGGDWAFGGVFDSEQKAVAACRSARYFVAPAPLNYATPEETLQWPGCYYPHASEAA